MTMPRFVDNARTAKMHEDGLMALVSSPLAPMSIKGLLRVQTPSFYSQILKYIVLIVEKSNRIVYNIMVFLVLLGQVLVESDK